MSEREFAQPAADAPQPGAIGAGHEPDPMSVRAMVWFVIGFIAFAIAAHWGIWLLLKHDVRQSRYIDRPRSIVHADPGPPSGAPALQPMPHHDVVPWQDAAEMHEAENRVFTQLGWTPDDHGHARIPDSIITAVAARSATRPSTQGAK
jgi:hypothetical protein